MRAEIVPLSSILMEDRAREEYGDLAQIEESAKTFMGQIQSIAVKETGDSDRPYRLLAGGRRLISFGKVGLDSVLVRIYPADLTKEQEKEIELVENVARLSLSWQEEAKLTKRVHDLKISIHGRKDAGTGDGWSARQTATALGRSRSGVQQDLNLAEAITRIPEVAECKTKRDAENLLARLEEKLITEELAKRSIAAQAKTPAEEIKKELALSYRIGDFFKIAPSLPSESYDLLEVDPPYASEFETMNGVNAGDSDEVERFRKGDFVQADPKTYPQFLEALFKECYRLGKPNSWILVWYAQHPWANEVYEQLLKAGYQLKRIPAIWNKSIEGAETPRKSAAPDIYLGRVHEAFYYARKGSAFIRKRARPDVFNYPTDVSRGLKAHPTAKPIPLMQEILETFATPESKILVPFLGSGNTLVAAHLAHMKAEGYELSEVYRNTFITNLFPMDLERVKT